MTAPAPLLNLSVPNRIERLADTVDAVEGLLRAWSVSEDDRGLVLVMLDEIASNIIQYAWDDGAPHHFRLSLRMKPDGTDVVLTMETVDDGVAFDPTGKEAPDLEADLEDRALGGLGLFMVGEISDECSYRREDGCNRLHVVKRLRTSAAATSP